VAAEGGARAGEAGEDGASASVVGSNSIAYAKIKGELFGVVSAENLVLKFDAINIRNETRYVYVFS
jgi:hypothetical protein